ncbi:hypothetical protein ACFX2B_033677 [Malus domestica]
MAATVHQNPRLVQNFARNFSLWSMKKDPYLESALSKNRRWIVNNQIKNIILRCPDQVATVTFIQKKFKTLDLQGKALNWLKKYPCCFQVYLQGDEYYCQLTKRMISLVEEEESVKDMQEPVFVERLAKLLMMSSNQRLNVVKLNVLRRNFGFPDDYLIRLVPKYSDVFRIVNYSGRRSSMEIELVSWNPDLAVSAIEASAHKQGTEPCFTCSLPSTWSKSWERFHEFNATPYISPYLGSTSFVEGSKEMEKRTVALVHELLSLTLWKKSSIMKLAHFRREFSLPEKLNVLLLKHPGIFYVSNKYQNYTVLLREAYNGQELVDKDPLVVVKEKFGELMQEGLHEYNRRRHLVNLEKKKKRGMVLGRSNEGKDVSSEMSDPEDQGDTGGLFDPEERKRFYKVLFDDGDVPKHTILHVLIVTRPFFEPRVDGIADFLVCSRAFYTLGFDDRDLTANNPNVGTFVATVKRVPTTCVIHVPFSLCKACIKDAVILCVRGNKGFCETCMKTSMMIEKNEQGNKDKDEVDFDDKSSWEYLFKDYWIDLKEKLSQFDVQALLLEYIKRNKLRDPRRKSQIVCDTRLQNLFGNHFLVKEDAHADHLQGRVVDTDDNQLEVDGNSDTPVQASKDKRPHSNIDFAAIENISLSSFPLHNSGADLSPRITRKSESFFGSSQCEADDELVDQKKYLEESCQPKCVKPLIEYQACVKRVEGDDTGNKHCTGQYFDYISCVDKCVAPKLFQKLK